MFGSLVRTAFTANGRMVSCVAIERSCLRIYDQTVSHVFSPCSLVNSADDLSKRPQVENTTAARTETNYDTPLRNGFQSLRYTTPKSSPDDKPKRTVSHNRKVQFGSIQAVVYYVDDPPPVWTEIPEDEASRKYSLDPPEPDNNAEELTQETKDNAAVLAEWDDDWDNVAVFEDAKDDEEELMFSLPAPPSRKTNRRRSSIFSPSGTAINLLECLPEQVEYPENKVVSESPEQALIDSPEMLGLQGLTNLSVQSPPVVEIAECTHSSPEDDSGSPSDLMKSFNKSPNDVRDVRETAVCLANLKVRIGSSETVHCVFYAMLIISASCVLD